MTSPPMFHGFDSLMNLSRREGVDIRPTLLRVLTDLYVQTNIHTRDEEQQYVELALRLIDEVDDATRAAVRARLALYPDAPRPVARKLQLWDVRDDPSELPFSTRTSPGSSFASGPSSEPQFEPESEALPDTDVPMPVLSMQPDDAAKLIDMFLAADTQQRSSILRGLVDMPLKPSTPVDARRAGRALGKLEHLALTGDIKGFTAELGDALILTSRSATQIVHEPGGEPLACMLKALGMSSDAFQRVLLFLNPELASSVSEVYRLARLYDVIDTRTSLIMLAAWRGATMASARAKYRPALHDEDRYRARPAFSSGAPPASRPGDVIRRLRG